MADVTQVIEFYKNLLIIQYHNKPKAQAEIDLFITQLLADGILLDIREGFNLDTAVGVQLDILGKYVGVDRNYQGQTLQGFFSFIDYDEVTSPPADRIGYSVYAAGASSFETKVGKFLSYYDVLTQNFRLADDDYRILIKLKILQNNINDSHQQIDDGLYKFFGDSVYADSEGDMIMYYFVPRTLSAIVTVAVQKQVLPKPMGVRLNWIIPIGRPYFGFATYAGYSNLITGFTNYTDYDTSDGKSLAYADLT